MTRSRHYLSATLTPVLCGAHGAHLLTDALAGDTVRCTATEEPCTLSVQADIMPNLEDGESLADAPHPDHDGAYVLAHLSY